MAGPGIRYFELAKAFAKHFEIVLFVPDACDIEADGFMIKIYDSGHASSSIVGQIGDISHVIAQNLRPPLLKTLRSKNIIYIADLYDPLTIEVLEYVKYDPTAAQNTVFDFNYHSLLLQIHSANHILCSSDRQKDFYTGVLSDQKLITPEVYTASPDLIDRISLLPFGLSKEKLRSSEACCNNESQASLVPNFDSRKCCRSGDKSAVQNLTKASEGLISQKFPNIKPDDKIVYWGGGIWNWFDPLTPIKAIEKISKTRGDIKLLFIGTKHPNPKIKEMEMAAKALNYCKEKDLLDKFVFFNFDWTPYEERIDYLLRSNIGISSHFDNLETRFSFRTRVLDYLWAELPMVLTRGDSMADLALSHNLGKVVDYENVEDVAAAIVELTDNDNLRQEIKNNIRQARKQFFWDNVILNLVNLIKSNKLPSNKLGGWPFLKLSGRFYWSGIKKKMSK